MTLGGLTSMGRRPGRSGVSPLDARRSTPADDVHTQELHVVTAGGAPVVLPMHVLHRWVVSMQPVHRCDLSDVADGHSMRDLRPYPPRAADSDRRHAKKPVPGLGPASSGARWWDRQPPFPDWAGASTVGRFTS